MGLPCGPLTVGCVEYLPRVVSRNHADKMPNCFSWPLSACSASLSSPLMPQLLSLSLWVSPSTMQKKLILYICIHNLTHLVTTQSSKPLVRVRVDWSVNWVTSALFLFTSQTLLHLFTLSTDMCIILWWKLLKNTSVQVVIATYMFEIGKWHLAWTRWWGFSGPGGDHFPMNDSHYPSYDEWWW